MRGLRFRAVYARTKPDVSNGINAGKLTRIVMQVINSLIQLYTRILVHAQTTITNGMSTPALSPARITHPYPYSDYNFIRSGDKCVPPGLERIPSTMCTTGRLDETYMGSSRYCLIAGDKCDKSNGVRKDEPVSKPCSQGMSRGRCRVDVTKRYLKLNL